MTSKLNFTLAATHPTIPMQAIPFLTTVACQLLMRMLNKLDKGFSRRQSVLKLSKPTVLKRENPHVNNGSTAELYQAFWPTLEHLLVDNNNNNNNTLFTHATSRSNKNSLKHVRETKSIENERNSLKLPF